MTQNNRDASLKQYDTFPKLLLRNAELFAGLPSFREKDLGIWQSWTWAEAAEEVRRFSLGLAALGLKRGDKVAIIGANRPQLYWSFDAIEAIGGIPVPLYADSVAEEMQFVVEHAEVRFAICEDQEQVDKILDMMEKLPSIEVVIYEDPRGMRHYDDEFLHQFTDVQDMGDTFGAENPDFYLNEIARASGKDMAIIAYTSGTTGDPKGVMLSHANLIDSARHLVEMEGMSADEEHLAYLPLAWVGDQIYSMGEGHVAGFTVNCPESPDTVLLDLREIGPTSFFALYI